jgi:hypothetical protein
VLSIILRVRRIGSAALLLFAWQFLQPCNTYSQASNDMSANLSIKVHDYRVAEDNFLEALCQVSADFKIPMGIVWVNVTAARRKLSLSWSDSTVQEIIEAITQTQPAYHVEVDNGIVHVFSDEIVPSQNFLFLEIPRFEVRNQAIEMASVNLRQLVKLTVSPPEPIWGGTGGSVFGNTDEPKLNLQLSNATVERILDTLAIASASNIWIVTFSNGLVLTPTGFRRTESLWSNSPIAENEQPVWDRVRWGDPTPSGLHKE